jgi:hypothetical protein
MLPIRRASGGQVPIAVVIGNVNDCLAHAGSVLGHHGQSIQEAIR